MCHFWEKEFLLTSVYIEQYESLNTICNYLAILCQYMISIIGVNYILNFGLSLIIAYSVTIVLCWLIDKLKFLRRVFGLK